MRRVILCVAFFRIMFKNRVRKSAARRNRVPAKPNRFCGMEERQPIKAKPYFYKKYGKPKGLPRRGGDGGKNFVYILSIFCFSEIAANAAVIAFVRFFIILLI